MSQLEGQLKQTPSRADLDNARKQSDDLRSQLAQATEQLKSSQGRVGQLEGQLKQVASSADLDNARKQTDNLQSQFAQATEQLKSSQGRINQLEGQLKSASADLDNARKQSDDLRSQLSTAMAIAEKPKKVETTALKSTPTPTSATTAAVARAGDQTEAFEHPEVTTKGQPLDSEGNKGLTDLASSGSLPLAAGPAAVLREPARPLIERSPPSADTSMLLARGDSLLGMGDIASARLFYERAADTGDGQAALRLGETYDPAFLERARLRVQGDRARAVLWYQRARELGASEAEILLKGAQVR
jgi:TPR repeat protein